MSFYAFRRVREILRQTSRDWFFGLATSIWTLQVINSFLQYSPRAGTFSPQLTFSDTFLQCSSEIDAFKQIMDKLQGVVPMKAATAAAALKPVPAKLSDEESKEVSIVRKSLTTKGAQTLPSGPVSFDLKGVSRLIKE